MVILFMSTILCILQKFLKKLKRFIYITFLTIIFIITIILTRTGSYTCFVELILYIIIIRNLSAVKRTLSCTLFSIRTNKCVHWC